MSVGSSATLPGSAETAGVGVAGAGHDPLEVTGAALTGPLARIPGAEAPLMIGIAGAPLMTGTIGAGARLTTGMIAGGALRTTGTTAAGGQAGRPAAKSHSGQPRVTSPVPLAVPVLPPRDARIRLRDASPLEGTIARTGDLLPEALLTGTTLTGVMIGTAARVETRGETGCGCLGERRRGPRLPRMEKFSVCSEHIVVVGFVCVGRSKGRTLETSCP
jgi:hypothetical protein